MNSDSVDKVLDEELPVPLAWRATLKKIADALVLGLKPASNSVRAIASDTLTININNIKDYPDQIGPLQDNTWNSSVYVWTGKWWEVLVDLSTIEQETSDLVLHLRVYDEGTRQEFEPGLVYVP